MKILKLPINNYYLKSSITFFREKFEKRFDFIETELEKQGKHPQDTSLSEMDVLWDKAKKT